MSNMPQEWDSNSCSCIDKCEEGYNWSYLRKQCEKCDDDTHWDPRTEECIECTTEIDEETGEEWELTWDDALKQCVRKPKFDGDICVSFVGWGEWEHWKAFWGWCGWDMWWGWWWGRWDNRPVWYQGIPVIISRPSGNNFEGVSELTVKLGNNRILTIGVSDAPIEDWQTGWTLRWDHGDGVPLTSWVAGAQQRLWNTITEEWVIIPQAYKVTRTEPHNFHTWGWTTHPSSGQQVWGWIPVCNSPPGEVIVAFLPTEVLWGAWMFNEIPAEDGNFWEIVSVQDINGQVIDIHWHDPWSWWWRGHWSNWWWGHACLWHDWRWRHPDWHWWWRHPGNMNTITYRLVDADGIPVLDNEQEVFRVEQRPHGSWTMSWVDNSTQTQHGQYCLLDIRSGINQLLWSFVIRNNANGEIFRGTPSLSSIRNNRTISVIGSLGTSIQVTARIHMPVTVITGRFGTVQIFEFVGPETTGIQLDNFPLNDRCSTSDVIGTPQGIVVNSLLNPNAPIKIEMVAVGVIDPETGQDKRSSATFFANHWWGCAGGWVGCWGWYGHRNDTGWCSWATHDPLDNLLPVTPGYAWTVSSWHWCGGTLDTGGAWYKFPRYELEWWSGSVEINNPNPPVVLTSDAGEDVIVWEHVSGIWQLGTGGLTSADIATQEGWNCRQGRTYRRLPVVCSNMSAWGLSPIWQEVVQIAPTTLADPVSITIPRGNPVDQCIMQWRVVRLGGTVVDPCRMPSDMRIVASGNFVGNATSHTVSVPNRSNFLPELGACFVGQVLNQIGPFNITVSLFYDHSISGDHVCDAAVWNASLVVAGNVVAGPNLLNLNNSGCGDWWGGDDCSRPGITLSANNIRHGSFATRLICAVQGDGGWGWGQCHTDMVHCRARVTHVPTGRWYEHPIKVVNSDGDTTFNVECWRFS